ncbi:MAG: endolytic transglycosylase MltG [Gammaproteobacteria bacterium]|nr:endolytic transglycosylase MltG [Gammaproteobacteria bacterium]
MRNLIRLFKLSILVIVVITLLLLHKVNQPLHLSEPYTLRIAAGSNLQAVTQQLQEHHVLKETYSLRIYARVLRKANKIQAGDYRLTPGVTGAEALDMWVNGKVILYEFTIIEGWSFRELWQSLKNSSYIEHTLPDNAAPKFIMEKLGYAGEHPEGRFFPDTYRFPSGTTDVDFLRRAYKTMDTNLRMIWQERELGLPLNNAYEALILASIVEKETGAAHERPLIAAVFINRLRKNMRLQTDPTIIYGIGETYDGNIRLKDLRKDGAYNTYTRAGLTPTPIAMPGHDALYAAVHPADSDALFFVSRGNGTHVFSKDLRDHEAAVDKFQRKIKKPK